MSMNDPLAQYRRRPIAPQGGMAPLPRAPEAYVAFEAKDKAHRLRIRSSRAPINSPGYNILLNVVYDSDGTHVMLVFTTLIVYIEGRNLQTLIYAIENEMADYIQEFEQGKWPTPVDHSEPFIEAIEIKTVGNPPMQRGGKPH